MLLDFAVTLQLTIPGTSFERRCNCSGRSCEAAASRPRVTAVTLPNPSRMVVGRVGSGAHWLGREGVRCEVCLAMIVISAETQIDSVSEWLGIASVPRLQDIRATATMGHSDGKEDSASRSSPILEV